MAKHAGFRVVQRGNRWQGWARDPQTKKYVFETKNTREEAITWAKEKSLAFEQGLEEAGDCEFSGIINDYMKELTKPLDGRPVTPLHAANTRRILERCRDEAGISDLKADDVAELTAEWIRNLCCRYKGTVWAESPLLIAVD